MANDDFFIGWAGPSRTATRFLLVVSAVLALVFAGTAAAITQLQRSPGASERGQQTYVGIFKRTPYGHLVVPGEDGPTTVLLSMGGKFGLQGQFLDKDDKVVSANGFGLNRDGRKALEVWGMQDAELPADQRAALEALSWEDLGEVTLTGEIVDSKCYYGRMRPGSGKGHRACAQLCVRGGVPPVLVTQAPDGRRSHVVIAGPGRADIHEEILRHVALPMQVTGKLERRGDLFVLSVDLERGLKHLGPMFR